MIHELIIEIDKSSNNGVFESLSLKLPHREKLVTAKLLVAAITELVAKTDCGIVQVYSGVKWLGYDVLCIRCHETKER